MKKENLVLRPYQEESADSVEHALSIRQSPLVVIPTGGGKSLVLAEVIRRLVKRSRTSRILLLSHVKELIAQNSNTLRRYAPEIAQGIYSAGLNEKRAGAQVVMGTVQSVSRALKTIGPRSFLIIDEAHLCPREQASQYGKVFEHYRLAPRIGFTATNLRLDSGNLTDGDDAWFDEVSYEIPVGDLIKQGYLLPLSGVITEQQALLDRVKSRAGDFIAERAEEEVMKLSLDEVVEEMLELSQLRSHLLIFAAGVKHATAVHAQLEALGVKTSLILGDTASGERDEALRDFKAGKTKALVSVGVLTTGFDAPLVDCIVCMRPTKSKVLWTQMLGRGMRLAPKKKNCLLLDFVGNLDRLGGAGCVTEVERKEPSEETRKKSTSPGGGVERRATDFVSASHMDPMGISENSAPFEAIVKRVRYFLVPSKTQPGKSILVCDYSLQTDDAAALECSVRHFICNEYEGYPRQLAERWFRRRGLSPSQVPRDARTALGLAQVLPEPIKARAFWDPSRRSYVVINEAFGAP